MPTSPSTPLAMTMAASPDQISRSGVTTCTSSGTPTPRPRQLLRLGLGFLDAADHVEGLFGQVVVLPLHQRPERRYGLLDRHVLALDPRELLGHEERLGQEPLDLAGASHGDLVLLR